jgi:poly(3-hydroxybutyrate) depolymerase
MAGPSIWEDVMRWQSAVCVVALLAAACGGGDDSDAQSATSDVSLGTTALTYSWTAEDGSVIDREYLLYVPDDYATEESWPLVLWLHGGPGPETVEDIATMGLPAVVDLVPYRFVMVAPLATRADMTAPTEVGAAWGAWSGYLVDLIDHVDADLAIDRDRIYFAGFSLGGTGVWQLALAEPDLPAALLPMAGRWESGLVPPNPCDIAGIPTRVIHGSDDPIVALADAERIVAALGECGGEVVFDILDGYGHAGVWSAFLDLQVADWLLAQGTDGAWPALPADGASLDNFVEIRVTLSPPEGTFEVTAGADALGCERGTLIDEAFQSTGFSSSYHCESGEHSGSGFSMHLVPDTNEWSITTGTGGFEGVEASGFHELIHLDPSEVRTLLVGEIGRAIDVPSAEGTATGGTDIDELDLALADRVFEAWNSLDSEVFISSLGAGATYDTASTDLEATRNEIGFWMGLGGLIEVDSCQKTAPDLIDCSVSVPDDLSGPEGIGFLSRVELAVDNGQAVSFQWWPTDPGKVVFVLEMARWVEQAHPEVWEATFSAPGCGMAIDCWDGRWVSSPEGAQTLLELRDEYLAERTG